MGKQAAAKPAAANAAAAKPAAKAAASGAGGGGKDNKAAGGKAAAKKAPEKAPAPGAKAEKANKRAEHEALEGERRAARDAMLLPSDGEEESSGAEGADEETAQVARTKAIAERERVKAEEEARALRAAERSAERESRLAASGRGRGAVSTDGRGGYPAAGAGAGMGASIAAAIAAAGGDAHGDDDDEDEHEAVGGGAGAGSSRASRAAAVEAKMLQKVEKGEKLSNKERRANLKHQHKEDERRQEEEKQNAIAEEPPEVQKWITELEAFSLNLPNERCDEQGNAAGSGGDAVSVEGFTLSAPGNELLSEASLTLAKGRRYGLLGPNGMGKTTLLKCLATRRFPIPAGWTVALVAQEAAATERSVVDEVLCADLERLRLTKEEAELFDKLESFQDDDGSGEELAKLCERMSQIGIELEATGAEAAESRVRQILVGLQFTDKQMEGQVKLLSGGWRMRVNLAKALFLAPDLLLLDEPTNHLDLDAVLWLDEFLSTEFKKTLLVVSHDADFLDSVCTDVIHLEDNQLFKYRGGYTMFKKQHAQRLQEREKEFKKLVVEGNKASGSKARQVDKEQIEKARPSKAYTVKFNFLPLVSDKNEAGISVHDINFSWNGKAPWLLGPKLNFRISACDRIAVVGKNGAGKSTLLNLLSKILWPSQGDVSHSNGLSIGRYSQHFEELGERDTLNPVELLTHPEVRRFGAGIEKKEQAHKSLGQFGLPTHAHTRPIKELSGGQKARVQFALLTCRRPEILILDEPTNHLDIESVEEIISALRRYEGGFILVSHDARLITSTQATLWEVDGKGGYKVRGEGLQGFEEYRKSVMTELERKRQKEEERARKQTEERRKRRDQAISRKLPGGKKA